MFSKKGILAFVSLLVVGVGVYLSPLAWSQEVPDDADILLGAMDWGGVLDSNVD